MDPLALAMSVLPFAYLILQAGELLAMRGWRRRIAWGCTAIMGAAVVVAVSGGLSGSNLAPIWVVFALPPLTAVLTLLWIAHLLRRL